MASAFLKIANLGDVLDPVSSSGTPFGVWMDGDLVYVIGDVGTLSLYKPPSGQSDGPAGVEGEWAQAISLDPLDEAAEKGRAVSW